MNFNLNIIYAFFNDYYNYIIVYLIGCPVALAMAVEKWGKPYNTRFNRYLAYFITSILSWALVLVYSVNRRKK